MGWEGVAARCGTALGNAPCKQSPRLGPRSPELKPGAGPAALAVTSQHQDTGVTQQLPRARAHPLRGSWNQPAFSPADGPFACSLHSEDRVAPARTAVRPAHTPPPSPPPRRGARTAGVAADRGGSGAPASRAPSPQPPRPHLGLVPLPPPPRQLSLPRALPTPAPPRSSEAQVRVPAFVCWRAWGSSHDGIS